MPAALSPRQAQTYEERGILFPVPLLSPAELSSYQANLAELEAHRGGRIHGYEGSQLHLHFAWAHELATLPRLLDLVQGILGPNFLIHSSTWFCKYPRDASFVSWHQDTYYWRLSRPDLVSAWIAFTDSTLENGCLRVIPGSHLGAVHPHHNGAMDARNLLRSGLVLEREPDSAKALNVTLKAGEVSFHHANLIHGSGPNESTSKRAGFAIRYVAEGVSQAGPHHEVIPARGHASGTHYRLAQPPPSRDFLSALQEHQAFTQRLRALRESQGRPDSETRVIPTT